MSDIPLRTIIKTPDEGMSFGRTLLAPSRRAPETCKFNPKLHRSWHMKARHFAKTLCASFNLSPIRICLRLTRNAKCEYVSGRSAGKKAAHRIRPPVIVTAGGTLKLNTEISLRSSLTHWSDREGTAPAFSARSITHRKRNKPLRDPWSAKNNWAICNGEIDPDSESRSA